MSVEFAAAPIRTRERRVPAEWIDYNGHMNVAYYTMAFDQALDEVFDLLSMGQARVDSDNMGPMALQTHVHYMGELLEGGRFACDALLIDADGKRIHTFLTMIDLETGAPAATYENLTVNVDLGARRSVPFLPETAALVEALRAAHAGLPRPPQVGAPLGIRRR